MNAIPQRRQRNRTKGWRMGDAVYVGRPSRWGNPYVLGAQMSTKTLTLSCAESTVMDPAHAVALYERWLDGDPTVPLSGWNFSHQPPTHEEITTELASRDLCCWCPADQPCHADVLLRIANGCAT